MKLWKFNRTTGYWNAVREVTKETSDQWLTIFKKQEPNEIFKTAINRPKTFPKTK